MAVPSGDIKMSSTRSPSARRTSLLGFTFLLLCVFQSNGLKLKRAPARRRQLGGGGGNQEGREDAPAPPGRALARGDSDDLNLQQLQRRERQLVERVEALQRRIADARGNRLEQEFWNLVNYVRRVAGPNFQFEEPSLPEMITPDGMTRIRAVLATKFTHNF